MNRYVSLFAWSAAAEILADPTLRSCYLLIFRPRIEEYQSLAPDPFLPCARSMVGKLYRQGRQIEVRHVAEVLAGMSDKIPSIGARR
jgi:hypothetical protein